MTTGQEITQRIIGQMAHVGDNVTCKAWLLEMRIAEAIDGAIDDEREACAKEAEIDDGIDYAADLRIDIGKRIRARGNLP